MEPFSNTGPPPQGGKGTGFWLAIVAAVLAVVGVVAVGGIYAVTKVVGDLSDDGDWRGAGASPSAAAPTPPEEVPDAEPPAGGGACQWAPSRLGEVKFVGYPPTALPAAAASTVTIASSLGPLTFKLDPKAPCTGLSFAFLAGKKYFDGTRCHRLTDSGLYVLRRIAAAVSHAEA